METGGPPNYGLESFTSASELANAAADRLLVRLKQRRDTEGPFRLAISGGRISGDFFKAVATLGRSQTRVFAGVHFFWADERCVPPEHVESNFRLANDSMLKPLGIPEDQIHRIHGEIDPSVAAIEAQAELTRIGKSSQGTPVLDLVLLGMGEDGHIASLFPPAPPKIDANEPVYRVVVAVKPPPHRITLTYSVLANAKDVWVLVAGAGKETAYQNSIKPNGGTPLARLLSNRKSTLILKNVEL